MGAVTPGSYNGLGDGFQWRSRARGTVGRCLSSAAVTASAQATDDAGGTRPGGLAGLTPTGRARVPLGWALYDFANTIFSYAIVSYAIGPVARRGHPVRRGERAVRVQRRDRRQRRAERDRLADPRRAERPGRRPAAAVPAVLHAALHRPDRGHRPSPALVGLVLFTIANFAYQAALIYYDSTLRTVSRPETRGTLSGIGVAIGYCGTIFIGLLIFLLDLPIESVFLVAAVLFGLFAIPIFLVVREPPATAGDAAAGVRDAVAVLGQLRTTIRARADVPGLPRFLLGRFFYSDAVNTIIVVMSVVATEAMGLTATVREPDPAQPDDRRGRRELRLGRARRPPRARSGR